MLLAAYCLLLATCHILLTTYYSLGVRLEMASLGEIDKHGREQTGLKATKRMVEKAALRPGERRGRTERVCDVVRAMLVAKDMRTIGAIAEALRALQAAGLVEVRRIKDRFTQPSGGGWRDLMVNLVVLGGDGAVRHVCEVQVAHEMMLTARKGLPGHEVYAVQRNAAEFIESCGLEAELRRAMVRALKKEGKTLVEILSEFDDAWILEDAEWLAAAGSKEELMKEMEANEEGRLAKVEISQNDKLTSLPESVGDCKGLQTLEIDNCSRLRSLAERLGECTALQQLKLSCCDRLRSLPERLGECKGLQTLYLFECEGLLSLPERLGECKVLQTLEVENSRGLLSLPEGLGECTALQTIKLDKCDGLLSLPERLGECTALQTLDLTMCSGLVSLPERLGECKGLKELKLFGCEGLLSVPDLSGLAQLKVDGVSNLLWPWKESGYKAFSFAAWLDTQIDEGTLTELLCPTSLTSLPERLGELKTLQTLKLGGQYGHGSCKGLVTLPDLSGLAQLEVEELPDHLEPWKDSGYKAGTFSRPSSPPADGSDGDESD